MIQVKRIQKRNQTIKLLLSQVINEPSLLFEDEQYTIEVDDDLLNESKRIVG